MKKIFFLGAIVMASLAVAACDKDNVQTPDDPNPGTENPTPEKPSMPEADLQLAMDRTTKVLYYGDRKTKGVYNYFLGLGDKEFIKDDEGDDAAPEGGHIIYFDVYAGTGADSFETAELPDGKYVISSETTVPGVLDGYYTRMQVNSDGKQTSVDFTEGYLEVKSSGKGKLLTALFTLKDGSTVSCLYEGELDFGDPNAGSGSTGEIPALSEDIDVTFTYGMGVYYGDQYGAGTDNYTVSLTSQALDEDGYATTGGSWVDLSFYTEAGSSIVYLVPGVYNVEDSYKAGTVEPGFALMGTTFGSVAAKVDADGNTLEESAIVSGKVTVGDFGDMGYRIAVDVVTENGKTVKGVYEGEINFDNQAPAAEVNTTLTGDYELKFAENAEVSLNYYGDYYGVNLANWILSIQTPKGDAIDIELLTPMTSKTEIPLPEKQYNMSVGNETAGFVMGTSDTEGLAGTWYWDLSTEDAEGYVYGYAAAIDGWVKLSKDGDKTAVSFEFVDEAYNLFSGSWTGVIPAAKDNSAATISSLSAHKAARHAAKKAVKPVQKISRK